MVFEIENLGPAPAEARGGLLLIGNFDGVHRGHRALVARAVEHARADDLPVVAVSFDPHPQQVFRPDLVQPPLTQPARRARLLRQAGCTHIGVFKTGDWLLGLEAEEFFDRVVIGQFAAVGLVEGPDFRFGKARRGDIQMLADLCDRSGVKLDVVDTVTRDGTRISTTRVRNELLEGRLDSANSLLGEPYRMRGLVTHGAGRGRGIGVPTANLDEIGTIIPLDGVYAARARVLPEGFADPRAEADPATPEADPIAAACNIGPNPTFGEQTRKVEAHLIDYDGDLYGRTVELEFLARLRGTRPFDGLEDLKAQIARDIAEAKRVAAS